MKEENDDPMEDDEIEFVSVEDLDDVEIPEPSVSDKRHIDEIIRKRRKNRTEN